MSVLKNKGSKHLDENIRPRLMWKLEDLTNTSDSTFFASGKSRGKQARKQPRFLTLVAYVPGKPLVNWHFAIAKMAIDNNLAMKNTVIFHWFFLYVYQRVNRHKSLLIISEITMNHRHSTTLMVIFIIHFENIILGIFQESKTQLSFNSFMTRGPIVKKPAH